MSTPPSLDEIMKLRANDKDDRRTPFIVGNVFCIFVALISVILRFWARRLVKASWKADDWTSLAGMLITSIYTAILLVMTNHEMGRHIWWLEDPISFVKLSLSAEVIYNAAIPVIKSSILLLYHRIFPQQWLNRTLVFLGLFIIAYSIAQIIADIFQCTPVNSLWGESPKQYCINFPMLIRICGIINILTDVAILALPMPLLWRLNLSMARKRLLIVMFLIGGIACVASIVRLFYVDKIGNSHDATWDYAIPALIANVELCVGVLAANLPTFRPLITGIISRRRAMDTKHTLNAASSYQPVKDSLQIPLRSLFSKRDNSSLQPDDMERLSPSTDHKVQTHISNGGKVWPEPQSNEVLVMTSFKTT